MAWAGEQGRGFRNYGLLIKFHGLWLMVHCASFVVLFVSFCLWFMVYGFWSRMKGIWFMVFDSALAQPPNFDRGRGRHGLGYGSRVMVYWSSFLVYCHFLKKICFLVYDL